MNIISQTVGKRRTTLDIHNDYLAPDYIFDIGFVKTQQGRVLERKETEKHDCRKLMKSYKIVEYVYKVEELIEPTEEEYILILVFLVKLIFSCKMFLHRKYKNNGKSLFVKVLLHRRYKNNG